MEENNKSFDGKLSLNKETVAELNNKQLNAVKGGGDDFDTPTINDNCFTSGWTTFADACEWCGFWHETCLHL